MWQNFLKKFNCTGYRVKIYHIQCHFSLFTFHKYIIQVHLLSVVSYLNLNMCILYNTHFDSTSYPCLNRIVLVNQYCHKFFFWIRIHNCNCWVFIQLWTFNNIWLSSTSKKQNKQKKQPPHNSQQPKKKIKPATTIFPISTKH